MHAWGPWQSLSREPPNRPPIPPPPAHRVCLHPRPQALNSYHPTGMDLMRPHPTLAHVAMPLHLRVWRAALSDHPDTQFIAYIIDGMEHGFLIGFQQPGPLRTAVSNCPSAEADPQVVADYIRKEVTLRRFLGPFTHESVPAGTHLGKFGVIPKGHTPGKWCLITDLSSQKV